MPGETSIGWTATKHPDGRITAGASWNPVTGCSHKSEGCRNCYAEVLSLQYGWSKKPWTAANAKENIVLHYERLDTPKKWRSPRRIFVNSMSDLFHELVPDAFIAEVFAIMAACPQHTFIILTKRPERAAAWPGPWPANVQMGTSVEDKKSIHRLDDLRPCKARTLLVSFEPLLEDLGPLDLTGYHWAIVGSESGKGARPMLDAWVRNILHWAKAQGLAFFFKQRSEIRHGVGYKREHPRLDGVLWEEYPPVPASPPVEGSKQMSLFESEVGY